MAFFRSALQSLSLPKEDTSTHFIFYAHFFKFYSEISKLQACFFSKCSPRVDHQTDYILGNIRFSLWIINGRFIEISCINVSDTVLLFPRRTWWRTFKICFILWAVAIVPTSRAHYSPRYSRSPRRFGSCCRICFTDTSPTILHNKRLLQLSTNYNLFAKLHFLSVVITYTY
jgi:hypothetical protein